jgi:predicted nucleotidyltransferase
LKKVRENLGLTQEDVAKLTGIPVNTIRNWEQEIRNPSGWALDLLIDRLLKETNESQTKMDESHGILSFFTIKKTVGDVVSSFNIDRVYLFGSYAKGQATEISDIDLYIESDLYGLTYFGFIELLREKLNKKVEVLSNYTINPSSKIDEEIKKTGILIYERKSSK